MPNKKIFISVAALCSMVIFSGCQNTPEVSTTAINQEPTITTTSSPLANTAAHQGALQLNDPTFCEKITDPAEQQQCKTDVADQEKSLEAQQKMDASLCANLSTPDKQAACKIQLEVLAKENQNKQQLQTDIAANTKQMKAIYDSGDYTKCKTLAWENSKIDCEINILTNKAIQTKNESWCDKATMETAKNVCHSNYKDIK